MTINNGGDSPADQVRIRTLLTDDEEVFKHGTDPFDADTDQDGAPAHTEVDAGSGPLDPTSIPGDDS